MNTINEQIEKFDEARKAVQVKKPISMAFDLGLLAGFDINTLEESKFKTPGKALDKYLKEICRDGVQLLLNEVFQLPVVGTDLGFVASLPKPTTVLPREKPIPKAKPLTRWQKFAKAKGIQNRKRDRMVFDEESDEYKPRFGFKGINQVDKDWCMEVADGADLEADLYSEARADKKARVEKNKAQQLRNEREAGGEPKPTKEPVLMTSQDKAAKLREERLTKKVTLERDALLAQVSTASMGKFDKKIKGEAKPKGVKRQFEPASAPNLNSENDSNLKILNKLTDGSAAKAVEKSNVVNVRKAIKVSYKDGKRPESMDSKKGDSKKGKGKRK